MRDMLIAVVVFGSLPVCLVRFRGKRSRGAMPDLAASASFLALRVPGARRVPRAAEKERPSPIF